MPTFSPSHPGQDWEAGIPEDGCPNNRRGSSGQLKFCLLGQRLQQHQGLALSEARPVWEGDRPWGTRCSPVLRCFFSRITPEGLVSCLYLTYWYAKNKYADYSLRKNGLWKLAWPEKVPEACLFCGLWLDLLGGTSWKLGAHFWGLSDKYLAEYTFWGSV